jgi:hypothetical protein
MKAYISRILAVAGAAVAAVALTAMPAAAVVGGTNDSNNVHYPNVGLVYLDGQPECTGTLFRTSPAANEHNLLMTAAHCTVGQTGQFSVDFAWDSPGAHPIQSTGVAYTNPNFVFPDKLHNLNDYNQNDDVAVIVLDQNMTGITPADLPSVGQVDTLNFKTQLLTVVGYGIDNFTNSHTFTYGPRAFKDVGINTGQGSQVDARFLKTDAGSCSGDSGGPNFLQGTTTIVAITSLGQYPMCQAHPAAYRIDSASTLNFLMHPTGQ